MLADTCHRCPCLEKTQIPSQSAGHRQIYETFAPIKRVPKRTKTDKTPKAKQIRTILSPLSLCLLCNHGGYQQSEPDSTTSLISLRKLYASRIDSAYSGRLTGIFYRSAVDFSNSFSFQFTSFSCFLWHISIQQRALSPPRSLYSHVPAFACGTPACKIPSFSHSSVFFPLFLFTVFRVMV